MAVIARVPRSVRRIVTLLAVAALIEFFVLPQIAGARRAAHLLGQVNPALVGLGVVLNLILGTALVVSIPLRGTRPLYTFAAGVGVVVFGFFAFLVVGLTRAEGKTARRLCRIASPLPFLDCGKVEEVVHRVAS